MCEVITTSTSAVCTGIGIDSIGAEVVLHAMPGILMHTFGDRWVEVYLPALAAYIVGLGADLSVEPKVRLPEGPRGRRSKLETRIGCVRSPSAAAPCEGPPLGRDLRYNEREGFGGHVWWQATSGRVYCVRCEAAGSVRPLSAETAPLPWANLRPWQQPTSDAPCRFITCSLGDEVTRAKLREATLGYLTGGFGRQIYVTSPQQRRAIFERASNPFDVGGRWQLADDVTPETAPEYEVASWIDLASLLLQSVAHLSSATPPDEFSLVLSLWRGWLDGTEEPPPRSHWDPLYADLMLRVVAPRLRQPGVVYIDARKLLAALMRTDIDGRVRMSHPAEELIRDLRSIHEQVRSRSDRASVLVLFPVECEADKTTGLGVARRVWASGR